MIRGKKICPSQIIIFPGVILYFLWIIQLYLISEMGLHRHLPPESVERKAKQRPWGGFGGGGVLVGGSATTEAKNHIYLCMSETRERNPSFS